LLFESQTYRLKISYRLIFNFESAKVGKNKQIHLTENQKSFIES